MKVPPVEPVRDGLWSVPVPIPDNPLGYTLVYLFATESGPVLVDTGWDDPVSWRALEDGVTETGHDLDDTYGVLVTHVHPDHHGLSEQVRAASGCWVAMHPDDAAVVSMRRNTDDGWLLQTAAVMLEAGAPEDDLAELPDLERLHAALRARPSLPTRLFGDGDVLDVPGWTVRAIWTPGHSPGHTCFAVDSYDLLLSGDHVLPRISPHIGLYNAASGADPLGDYLASLDKLYGGPVAEVLPAHLHRFTDLPGRLDALKAHHEERLAAILGTLGAGPLTLWDIAAAMPWNKRWVDIPPLMKRAALSEALAHLRHLDRRGQVEEVPAVRPTAYRLRVAASAGAPGPAAP